jgi:hypothetical protein
MDIFFFSFLFTKQMIQSILLILSMLLLLFLLINIYINTKKEHYFRRAGAIPLSGAPTLESTSIF